MGGGAGGRWARGGRGRWKGWLTTPTAKDRLGEPTANGAADGHASEGGETRRRPRRLIEQSGRNAAARTPAEVAKECLSLGAKAAEYADGEYDETEAAREGGVLVGGGVAGDVCVCG